MNEKKNVKTPIKLLQKMLKCPKRKHTAYTTVHCSPSGYNTLAI
jgi:hypothetical protein